MLVFQDFEGLTEVFAPGRPPGYSCGCPRDIGPKTYPKGPKIEKIQDRRPGLKFSIETEIFKRATHQTPIFVGNSEGQD